MVAHVVVLAFSLSPMVVGAGGSTLKSAVGHYESLDFETALRELEQVLAQAKLTSEKRQQALMYLGRVHAVLKHPVSSHEAFKKALELAPTSTVSPGESPLIQEAFTEARQQFTDEQAKVAAERVAREQAERDLQLREQAAAEESVQQQQRRKRWLWSVGVVAVVGAAATIFTLTYSPPEAHGGLGRWELP